MIAVHKLSRPSRLSSPLYTRRPPRLPSCAFSGGSPPSPPSTGTHRAHATGTALALRAAGRLQFRASQRHRAAGSPRASWPGEIGRSGCGGGQRPGAPRHHRFARPPGRKRQPSRRRPSRRATSTSAMLDRMAASGDEVNVSVKLTQMGLDISRAALRRQHDRDSRAGGRSHGFVRLDMEGSDYTQRTLDFFSRRVCSDRFGAHCGVVIQSMLRRSEAGHRRSDRNEGARAALQGRLPGAAPRSPFPTRPTWTGTTCG